MNTALKIDFVSDVSCPWCAIGLAALGFTFSTDCSRPSSAP